MSPKDIKSKILTLGVIIILVFSIFLTVNVSAEWVKLTDEGIWYDEFENEDDVVLDDYCVNRLTGDGDIILAKGSPVYEYNYSGQSSKIQIYEHLNAFVQEGTLAGLLSVLISPEIAPGLEITEKSRLAKIEKQDGESLDTMSNKFHSNIQNPAYPIQHFRFKVTQDEDLIKSFTLRWWFGNYDESAYIDEVEMRLWSYAGLQKWNRVRSIDYEDIDFEDENRDLEFTFNIDENYISEEGYIDVLIIGFPSDETEIEENYAHIKTDYISLSVETIEGYWPEGTAVSELIEIDFEDDEESEFGGWESVYWESSKITEDSSVTVQILDQNDTLIEGYSSTTSPMDISGIHDEKIKLKAILRSNSPKITPSISNWRITWQKEDGYDDSFSSDYRVEETNGVKLEDGEIKVSAFSSNWEYFGKNPSNTRAYDGKAITTAPDEYYWYTRPGVGGGYRTPVTSEGRVYVASADKKIYAYNETQDDPDELQEPVDVSNTLPFEVESCIAVAGDYLIVGTSKPGEKNKLYALNKYNLSQEIWDEPYPSDDETICFTAPPVFEDGVLYLNTWGGTIFDTYFLSSLSSFFGKNNKLIALNLETGNTVWDPVDLPSGSFSSPAIGNNYIFAGCQNMYGSSLFAYSIEDGEEIWNQTVGVIGRSSPVYADGMVFVCANSKEQITESGSNLLFAVDASDGDVLWNITIGKMDSMSLIHILQGSSFFYRLIEGFAPISGPVYYDSTVYTLTPNGTLLALDNNGSEKWSYDFSSEILNIFSFYTASPLIVDNYLYVALGNGMVYAFNIESNEANPSAVWSFGIVTPGHYFIESGRTRIIASPILSDGLLFISSTKDNVNLSGRLYCVGKYAPNTVGNVTSSTIHVPHGNWWNSFTAEFTDTENNTIDFKILDEDGKTIKTISRDEYNDTFNDISDVNSNGIKIYASFDITNYSEALPKIDSWHLDWNEEDAAPYFIYPSDSSTEKIWINDDNNECSVEVRDKRDEDTDILSGIDATSAKYKIEYISTESDDPETSPWIDAECEDVSGVLQTTITAYLDELTFDVYQFLSIRFLIRDLAGNEAISNTTQLYSDVKKPVSSINNIESIKGKYNDTFEIYAEADDMGDGAENTSGIQHVSLIYKYKENEDDSFDEDWKYYQNKSAAIYSWVFGRISGDTMPSGYYKLSTRAKDWAGNLQDIDTTRDDTITSTFLFDDIDPEINTAFESSYTYKELPNMNLNISDDFMLDSFGYRLDDETKWTWIKQSGINAETYSVDWVLSESKWTSWDEGETHHIYFIVTDEAGNVYEDNPLKITKENMDDFFIDLSNFAEFHLDKEVTIHAAVPDYLNIKSVQLLYSFSEDNSNWDEYTQVGENLTSIPYSWKFEPSKGDGYYRFRTKITTVEGNIFITDEDVNYTSVPTTLFVVLMLMTTILLFVTAIVLYRIKSKK